MNRRFFVTDCEGPLTINDNAFELSGKYMDNGGEFFQIISKYDDLLADEIKRQGYNAGDTLKLILPFLKAYGATNRDITEFSEETILLIPGALDTLQFVYCTIPSFIISTSYEQYIQALCNLTGFPFENTYSTRLDLDKYPLSNAEKKKIKELKEEILDDQSFENLEKIFWETFPQMEIGRMISEVKTVGGEGKKEAVQDILGRFKFKASDMMYVGDSITDVQPLRYAKDEGGLAVSFNGNGYALKETELAVMADNTLSISIIADLFKKAGKDEVIEFVALFSDDMNKALYDYPVDPQLTLKSSSLKNTRIELVDDDNRAEVKEESLKYRKSIRGESIGGLG